MKVKTLGFQIQTTPTLVDQRGTPWKYETRVSVQTHEVERRVTTTKPEGFKGKVIAVFTLMLFAFTSFGQVANYPTLKDYILPANEWGLESVPRELSVKSWQSEDTSDFHELLYYNLDSGVVTLTYFNAFVCFNTFNNVLESYNELTGITCITFEVLSENDCSKERYVQRLQVFRRPSTQFFYITFDSPCDGILIRTGDPMLKKALNMKYQPPAYKKPVKKTKIITSSISKQ